MLIISIRRKSNPVPESVEFFGVLTSFCCSTNTRADRLSCPAATLVSRRGLGATVHSQVISLSSVVPIQPISTCINTLQNRNALLRGSATPINASLLSEKERKKNSQTICTCRTIPNAARPFNAPMDWVFPTGCHESHSPSDLTRF